MGDYGVSIDFSGLDEVLNIERLKETMQPEVLKAMEHARGQIVRLLPDGATGNLRRAPMAIAVATAEGIEGRVFVKEDSPAFKYYQFVEFGRAPGKFPPWGEGTSLFLWAQRKATTKAYQTTGKVSRKTPARQKMIKSISFLIARKEARFGTKAQMPFARGWTAAQPRVETIIEYGLQKAVIQ